MDASPATPPRVALLARAGEACERITGALREAGAEVVLVADPLQAEPGQVRQASAQAILVVLEPAIEDAIERYADVLADPGYMVIFEEAEQAAQRTGWDAARWLRHLSAKLHRHSDVLPAGAEADESLLPTPGPLRSPAPDVDYHEAIAAVTGEAQQRADAVPRDSGTDGPDRLAPTGAGLELALEAAPAVEEPAVEEPAVEEPGVEEPTVEEPGWELAMGDPADPWRAAPPDGRLHATDGFELELPVELPSADAAGGSADDAMSFDPERFARAGQAEAVGGIEEFLAARLQQAPDADEAADGADTRGQTDAVEVAVEEPGAVAPAAFAGLSLVEDDASVAPVADAAATPAFDLDRLGGGLSLADPDSYGHGPVRGAIVIEAGLGGPDAVRQLLAGIPEGFARPILVRLALDGGRYDRLVRQMTRATTAPVSVAEEGQVAQAGHVYFVPPGLGLSQRGGWRFDPASDFDLAALPVHDSAVLFLSGANAGLVAAVSGSGWSAGLVLAQTPDEGCYDPVGAQAAIAAGAGNGTPGELAARLLARWQPAEGATGPDPDPSGMLQP